MGEEIGATQSTIVLPTELSALPGIFVKFNVKCDRSQLTFLPTLLLPFFFHKGLLLCWKPKCFIISRCSLGR